MTHIVLFFIYLQNLHIERNTNSFNIVEVTMKLAMLLSSLLLTILCTKFTPGEALNGMREYKKNWQGSTRELLKRILLGHTLNDKSSYEISRDLSPPSSDAHRPPSSDEWTQLFDPSSCSVCMFTSYKPAFNSRDVFRIESNI